MLADPAGHHLPQLRASVPAHHVDPAADRSGGRRGVERGPFDREVAGGRAVSVRKPRLSALGRREPRPSKSLPPRDLPRSPIQPADGRAGSLRSSGSSVALAERSSEVSPKRNVNRMNVRVPRLKVMDPRVGQHPRRPPAESPGRLPVTRA
jgi:hypothetical protein